MTTSDLFAQAHGSSSPRPKVVSVRSEAIIELGKRIVDELGIDESTDTLGRWMAHYVAELIKGVETATIEEQPARSAHCATAILDFWRHRRDFPNGRRPFEDFEPVLRTLESLDPGVGALRYYRSLEQEADEAGQDPKTRKWLEAATALDYAARILIRHCLARAAEVASDRARPWVALADAAGIQDDMDLTLVKIVMAESGLQRATEPDEIDRKRIEERIQRLDAFTKMARALGFDLRRQLKRPGLSKTSRRKH